MIAWDQFKDVAPRPAAAVLLVRHIEQELEVLLGKRNDALKFMGGHHVFPGGGCHRTDSPELVAGASSDAVARGIFAAAREAFEETGILCARGELPALELRRDWRRRLIRREVTFGELLLELGLSLHAADFTDAGIWVTPPFSPIRFHTHYFLFEAAPDAVEELSDVEDEIVGLEWLTPREARRRWHFGELKLSTPVAFVLQHLAAFPLQEAIPWLRNTPGHDLTYPNRFELRRGLHLIPVLSPTLPPATHTNCLVIGEEALYIVDPGAAEETEQRALKDHLDHLCALGARVEAVLLTHSHPDHIGTADWLRHEFGCPVWAHAGTAAQIPFPVDRLLEHDEVLTLEGDPGWRVRCLHTPGHDPGHLCFLEETTRTLYAGDMVANPGTIVISPDYHGSMDEYLGSLERLLDLPFSFLIPSHGLPVWGGDGKEVIRGLIAHRLEREKKIQQALDGGATSMDQLIAEAYGDTPQEAWPIAEHQLRAHLARLGVSL